ncbi:MAG: hypothetical protein H6721_00640 [Sandaracinus sp.]|nr:hypothetical protein [Myxococcales bacterium]MCB9618497.1 hypothetical protein [Sandaracinus sp.]MCB9630651.1 hypothetical protein [Sandaracinus sp.]
MKKLRLLAGLYAALAAMTGCVVEVNFEPIGGDVTVQGNWTINGGVADATSCGAAGIQTVRLQVCEFVDGDCYTATNLQAACSAGALNTGPLLLADTYALRWQAILTDGTVSNGAWETVTAPAASTITTSVNFETAGPAEDTLAGTWTVGGAPADATSCASAGIMNVRLAFYTDDQGVNLFRQTTFPCSDGGFDSRTGMGPTLPDGMYYSEWQALDASGAVIAASELPLLELDTSAVTHANLAPVDFPAGEPMLTINVRYEIPGTGTDGTCAEAGVSNNRYIFDLFTAAGAAVSLDPDITTCVNQVELPGLPAGSYNLEIAAESADGSIKWGTGAMAASSCGGISYDGGRVEFDCFVDITP